MSRLRRGEGKGATSVEGTGVEGMSKQERDIRSALSSVLIGIPFFPMEKTLLFILADGKSHSRDELVAAANDPTWTPVNLTSHIGHIRDKIKHLGHGILCESRSRRYHYRYVIFLHSLVL